jgi:nucleotide-binding universal stress UspA family protein
MRPTHTVVVGVDGSASSRRALRYAMDEADRRAAALRVVAAFEPPEYWDVVYGGPVTSDAAEVSESVRVDTQHMIDEVSAGGPPLTEVELVVAHGSAVSVLLDASEGAEVLVLGHRGRGGAAGALLGSVGLQCALHATCPVTIVRPSASEELDEAGPPAPPAWSMAR